MIYGIIMRKKGGGMMIKKFISYYKPHKKIFFLDMLASLIVSLIGVIYPIVTRNMLNKYIPERHVTMIVFLGITLLLLY